MCILHTLSFSVVATDTLVFHVVTLGFDSTSVLQFFAPLATELFRTPHEIIFFFFRNSLNFSISSEILRRSSKQLKVQWNGARSGL